MYDDPNCTMSKFIMQYCIQNHLKKISQHVLMQYFWESIIGNLTRQIADDAKFAMSCVGMWIDPKEKTITIIKI